MGSAAKLQFRGDVDARRLGSSRVLVFGTAEPGRERSADFPRSLDGAAAAGVTASVFALTRSDLAPDPLLLELLSAFHSDLTE